MVDGVKGWEWTRRHGDARGAAYYLAALEYAQSLWREGKPAQAILQLNKAWMADLRGEEEVLEKWRPPFAALGWMLRNRQPGRFLGNPVRHFQHLATRMSGPRAEARAWRAWGCQVLAAVILDEGEFPPDREQMEKEQLTLPGPDEVERALERLGWTGEVADFRGAVRDAGR